MVGSCTLALAGLLLAGLLAGCSSSTEPNPFREAAEQVAAEKAELVEAGEYLPPDDQNLLRLLEDVGTGGDPPIESVRSIRQYQQMPDVPDTDLVGTPTGADPSEWYAIEFCSGGSVYRYDVNPHTVNAFQDSLGISLSGDAC